MKRLHPESRALRRLVETDVSSCRYSRRLPREYRQDAAKNAPFRLSRPFFPPFKIFLDKRRQSPYNNRCYGRLAQLV